jgi:predicted metalloprotease
MNMQLVKIALMAAGAYYVYTLAEPYLPLPGGGPIGVLSSAPRHEPDGPRRGDRGEAGQGREGDIDYRLVAGTLNTAYSGMFQAAGKTFRNPVLVVVDHDSGGPHYDPGSGRVTYPADFAREIRSMTGCQPANCLGVAVAVTAHEWGHHTSSITGMISPGPQEELRADCFAGAALKYASEHNGLTIEAGDIDAALRFAGSAGSASHGSGSQRRASFQRGFQGGSLSSCTGRGGAA